MVLVTGKPRMPQQKKRINVSIDPDLLAEARALEINLSRLFEDHLRESLHALRCRAWLKRNRRALMDSSPRQAIRCTAPAGCGSTG